VVVGQPMGSGPARGVAWSVPYAGARFALLVPAEGPEVGSLADLRGRRVGIVAGTLALAEKDHEVRRFVSREALLDGFGAEKLDAAFLDADFAAWYLHDHPGLRLKLVDRYVPRERWNMAVAVRAGDGPLLVEINRVLSELAGAGAIRKVYDEHGVPFHPPFTFGESSKRPEAPDTW